MIRQDDKRFEDQWIISEGCAYMCVLDVVNEYTNIALSPATIEVYRRWMLDEETCFTDDNLIIWENAFEFLGLPVKYLGKQEEGSDFALYNWHNPMTGYYHFTRGKNGICTMDPLGRSNTVRNGRIHSVRGFKVL